MGCIFLGFMVFPRVVEQVGPDNNSSILAYLPFGASITLRGVASLLQERREMLATSLCLLCVAGGVIHHAKCRPLLEPRTPRSFDRTETPCDYSPVVDTRQPHVAAERAIALVINLPY